jgi:hypothetical protein
VINERIVAILTRLPISETKNTKIEMVPIDNINIQDS